jgi:hypothetical protein
VQEALFSVGILKCGLVDSDYIELIPGEPVPTQDYYCEVIEFEDFAYDVTATSFDRASYLANRYLVDRDALLEMDLDEEVRRKIKGYSKGSMGNGAERHDRIGPGSNDGEFDEFVEQVALWDVWLPEHQLLLTLLDDKECGAVVRSVDWDGPPRGPYHFLKFMDVPGSAMPLAPGQLLRSLNKSENALFRKLIRQAERQKTIGLVQAGQNIDAEAIRNASDGQLVPVQNPGVVNEYSFGGASQESLMFAMQIDQLFSRMAGNLDTMGGLSTQADTASQEQMIGAAVSKKAAKMGKAVIDATTAVIEDLLYYMWSDPIREYKVSRPLLGGKFELEGTITPEDREAENFEDLKVKVDPYSMQYRSPQEKVSQILQLLTQVVAPMAPMFAQQGFQVNVRKLFEKLAKEMNEPDIMEIFETGVQVEVQGGGDRPRQSPVTHRTNERVSRSAGPSQRGMANQMMQNMSSKKEE